MLNWQKMVQRLKTGLAVSTKSGCGEESEAKVSEEMTEILNLRNILISELLQQLADKCARVDRLERCLRYLQGGGLVAMCDEEAVRKALAGEDE